MDTDHVSLVGRNASDSPLVKRILNAPEGSVATSIISYEEQMRGWLAHIASIHAVSAQVEVYGRLEETLRFYAQIPLLQFDARAVEEFQNLWLKRLRVGTMDQKIAAIALANDAIVLTRNARDFGKIPGLRIPTEDWTA